MPLRTLTQTMYQQRASQYTPSSTTSKLRLALFLFIALIVTSCTGGSTRIVNQTHHTTTFISASPNAKGQNNQQITYSTQAQDILLRTFYGGGLSGSLSLAPQISIYGDGRYILGTDVQGQLTSETLEQLLHTLVDMDGLLTMHQQQFSDVPDQNATFLEVNLNGKQLEFMDGLFGHQQEPSQALSEYQHLNQALQSIKDVLQAPTFPYSNSMMAFLVHQDFSPDLTQSILPWPLSTFTLAQATTFECGAIPQDTTSQNPETACLKYTIPQNAILLTASDLATLQTQMPKALAQIFSEQGLSYQVVLRPLLPDELATKTLAMFGSAQSHDIPVPLWTNTILPTPSPTPGQ